MPQNTGLSCIQFSIQFNTKSIGFIDTEQPKMYNNTEIIHIYVCAILKIEDRSLGNFDKNTFVYQWVKFVAFIKMVAIISPNDPTKIIVQMACGKYILIDHITTIIPNI